MFCQFNLLRKTWYKHNCKKHDNLIAPATIRKVLGNCSKTTPINVHRSKLCCFYIHYSMAFIQMGRKLKKLMERFQDDSTRNYRALRDNRTVHTRRRTSTTSPHLCHATMLEEPCKPMFSSVGNFMAISPHQNFTVVSLRSDSSIQSI